MPPKHAVLRGLARTSSSFLTTNASLQTRKTCSAIDPSVGGFSSHRVTQTHAHTPRALSVSFSVEWPASYAQPRRRQRETKRKREKERRCKRRGRVAERAGIPRSEAAPLSAGTAAAAGVDRGYLISPLKKCCRELRQRRRRLDTTRPASPEKQTAAQDVSPRTLVIRGLAALITGVRVPRTQRPITEREWRSSTQQPRVWSRHHQRDLAPSRFRFSLARRPLVHVRGAALFLITEQACPSREILLAKGHGSVGTSSEQNPFDDRLTD